MARKLNDKVLSLSRFLLRQQVIRLYREFLRTIAQVEDKAQRTELKDWVKQEFLANKHLDDEDVIKMQLSRGRQGLQEVENTVSLSQAKTK